MQGHSTGKRRSGFLSRFGTAFFDGDIWVKLSVLFWGLGYFRRGQWVKGVLATLFQLVFIYFLLAFALPNLSMVGTLGKTEYASVYNPDTMKNEVNDYDDSFLILLFSVISVTALIAIAVVLMNIIIESYKLEIDMAQGKHINSFREDVKELFDSKFRLTLMFLPTLGIIIFTIIPLIFMIAIAFTNYDQSHMPPTKLFTWVGFENFLSLFRTIAGDGSSQSSAFGYSFVRVLAWTLIWAFFATFTNYFGGIILSLAINNPRTRLKKLWRTLFIIAIAVPQFVTLLLMRNFFGNLSIVNTICSNIGLTGLLQRWGWITTDYIPFMTNAAWTRPMIILINFWIGVPYLMLIATGVLMNVPQDLYESARIDGANKAQSFFKITMPFVFNVTGPYLVTSFIANINNFNVIYLLTNDYFEAGNLTMAAAKATEVDLLITWLYRLTNDYYNYRMASVIGILVFIVCIFFTLLAFNYTLGKGKEETFR